MVPVACPYAVLARARREDLRRDARVLLLDYWARTSGYGCGAGVLGTRCSMDCRSGHAPQNCLPEISICLPLEYLHIDHLHCVVLLDCCFPCRPSPENCAYPLLCFQQLRTNCLQRVKKDRTNLLWKLRAQGRLPTNDMV